MKESTRKLIVTLLAAVILFVGIYALYNKLSGQFALQTVPDSRPDGEITYTEEQGEVSQSQTEEKVWAAPDFTMVDGSGAEVSLSRFFGKPIVLNFWASWCPPCKAEMPHFEQAFKDNPDIEFIMLNVTVSDSMSDAQKLIADLGYTFPVYYDTEGIGAYIYGATSLPTTFFIGADGNLVTYGVGQLSEASLAKGIEMIKE